MKRPATGGCSRQRQRRRVRDVGNTLQTRLMMTKDGQLGLTTLPPRPMLKTRSEGNDLAVFQWNAFHLGQLKVTEMSIMAAELKLDVMAVCEVHPVDSEKSIPRMIGFEGPSTLRVKGSKGLAMYVRCGVRWTRLEKLDLVSKRYWPRILTQGIQVHRPDGADPVTVLNIYIHPDTRVTTRKAFWKRLQKTLDPTSDFIIVGDLNEPSMVLSTHNTQKSCSFGKFMEKMDLYLANDGSPTYVKTRLNDEPYLSALDVTLCSDHLSRSLTSWSVLEHLDSDHFPIVTRFELGVETLKSTSRKPVKNWKSVRKDIRTALALEDIHQRPLELMKIIGDALGKHCHTRLPSGKTTCPWWDDELEAIRKLKNKLRRKKKYAQVKEMKREQRRMFRRKKKHYFFNLCQTIAEAPNPWKILRILAPETLTKRPKGRFNPDPVKRQAKVSALADVYEKRFNEDPRAIIPPTLLTISDGSRVNVSGREIDAALAQANRHSAGGHDNIRYDDLKKIMKDSGIKRYVIQSFEWWCLNGFPADAKIAKVYPIPKTTDPDGDYRPISLLSCLVKLLERILTTKLHVYVDPHIPPNQCGCRAGLSTTHCLLRLLHASAKAYERGRQFVAVFLDFSKAYDRVNHSILLEKLKHKCQVPDGLVRAVGLWLSRRTFYVEMSDCRSSRRPMTNGLPQGSALSVLLWLVYVSDMPVDVHSSALFMDDTALWGRSRTITGLRTKVQAQLDLVTTWCQTNRILLNGSKTKILMNEYDPRFELTVGDTLCEPNETVRYLGIDLRAKFGYSGPIEIDLARVSADLVRRCRVLRPLHRRLPGPFYRMFAQGLIISKLRYYLPVLAAESNSTLKPLRVAYRQCLRLMCGGLRTTPLTLLHSQSGLPTLDKMIEDASLRLLMRSTERPGSLMMHDYSQYRLEMGSPYSGMHLGTLELAPDIRSARFENRVNLSEADLESICQVDFNILPTSEVAKIYLRNNKLIPEADWYLFTDGSYRPPCRSGPEASGAGAVLQASDGLTTIWSDCRKVVPACHSYHSEVQAMTLGLQAMVERFSDSTPGSKICVLTDSQSLLRHLEAQTRRLRASVPRSTKTLIELIRDLTRICQITFVWIPGHEGIQGNELADEKAKEGLQSSNEMIGPYPISTLRLAINQNRESALREYLMREVQESKVNTDAPLRRHFKTPRMSPPWTAPMTRQAEVSMFRLYSGHCNTRVHWPRVGIEVETTDCRFCKSARETSQHLMMECRVIWNRDRRLLTTLRQVQMTHLSGDLRFQTLFEVREGPVFDIVVKIVEELMARGVRF